jgi:hypothetical protein
MIQAGHPVRRIDQSHLAILETGTAPEF